LTLDEIERQHHAIATNEKVVPILNMQTLTVSQKNLCDRFYCDSVLALPTKPTANSLVK
jgi:hypothetical protein